MRPCEGRGRSLVQSPEDHPIPTRLDVPPCRTKESVMTLEDTVSMQKECTNDAETHPIRCPNAPFRLSRTPSCRECRAGLLFWRHEQRRRKCPRNAPIPRMKNARIMQKCTRFGAQMPPSGLLSDGRVARHETLRRAWPVTGTKSRRSPPSQSVWMCHPAAQRRVTAASHHEDVTFRLELRAFCIRLLPQCT